MRKRKITVRPYKHSRLKFVVNYREAGKVRKREAGKFRETDEVKVMRKRQFFESKEAANAFAAFKNAELRKVGIDGAEFPARLREMARECTETLSAYGKTIADATNFFVAQLKASERSITAADLVPKLIDTKEADGM